MSKRNYIEKSIIQAAQKAIVKDSRPADKIITVELLDQLNKEVLPYFVKEAYKNGHYIIKGNKVSQALTRRRIRETYYQLFCQLECIISFSLDIAKNISNDYESQSKRKKFKYKEQNEKYVTSLQLHGRGILAAKEILILLKNGFPNGAMGRWRTLYEYAIISLYLSEKPNLISKQYLDYDSIERFDEMKSYQKNASAFNLEPFTNEDVEQLSNKVSELSETYGKKYSTKLGWAKCNNEQIVTSFSDIEKDVNFSDFNFFYKTANNCVHGGPKGANDIIGNNIKGTILVGQSDSGFLDVIRLTSLMLFQLTISIGKFQFVLEDTYSLQVLLEFHFDLMKMCSQMNYDIVAPSSV